MLRNETQIHDHYERLTHEQPFLLEGRRAARRYGLSDLGEARLMVALLMAQLSVAESRIDWHLSQTPVIPLEYLQYGLDDPWYLEIS